MNTIHNTDITFNANGISSYAGGFCVLDFLKQVGVKHLLDTWISEHLKGGGRPQTYGISDVLYALMCGFSLGAKHPTDISQLRNDHTIIAAGLKIPSQATFSKEINNFDETVYGQLSNIHHRICDQWFREATKEEKLECVDISDDSSGIETFGKQDGSAYISHYGITGFHPDFTTEDSTRMILLGKLREGNIYSSKGSELLIEDTLKRYGKYAEIVKFRADSAYGKGAILDVLHGYKEKGNCVEAYVKAKTYSGWLVHCEQKIMHEGVEQLIIDLPRSYFEETIENGEIKLTDRYFTIYHQASGRKRAEKVVVRMRWYEDPKGESFFAFANKDVEFLIVIGEKEGEEAFKEYAKRGKQEQIMEEVKNDAFLKKLSQRKMIVNECMFLIKIIVHNLMQILRIITLEGTKYANCKIRTLRKILVNIGGKITLHARKMNIQLSKVFLYKQRYITALERLRKMSLRLA